MKTTSLLSIFVGLIVSSNQSTLPKEVIDSISKQCKVFNELNFVVKGLKQVPIGDVIRCTMNTKNKNKIIIIHVAKASLHKVYLNLEDNSKQKALSRIYLSSTSIIKWFIKVPNESNLKFYVT